MYASLHTVTRWQRDVREIDSWYEADVISEVIRWDPSKDLELRRMESELKLATAGRQPLEESGGHSRSEGERSNARQDLRGVHERFESAFGDAPIGMGLIDMEGNWLQVNSALCRITGYSQSELKATTLRALTHPDDVDLDLSLLQQLVEGQIPSYQIEKRYRHVWGHFVWMLVTISLVQGHAGQAPFLITQFQDISDRKQEAQRLEFMIDHDFLTGLFNRRHFEQELAREVERAKRYGTPGAVLLIDLDNFKDVNDTFGHMAGDDLLKGIGGLLKHRIRHTDTLARIGGDEFAVLLPETDAERAVIVADEFVKALNKQTAILADQSLHITASVGISLFGRLGAAEVLACSDLAMYEAKQAGRNRYAMYRSGNAGQDPGSARLSEAERLRQAVEEHRFLLYCQPILDLQTMEVRQHELLLRLPGSEGCECLSPKSFLYIAERMGLILSIDSWVVREAILLIAAHARAGRSLVLSVNISGKSIGDPKLSEVIEGALAETGINPECLILELTETAAIANLEQARAFTDRLRSRGCQVALDDFGAGFASFYYLKNFPFDYLKIDGEFIRDLAVNPVNQLIVNAIVGIAQGMSKKTIAEFVGDANTMQLLRNCGVDYAQGYHIGQPQPVTEALAVESQNSAGLRAPESLSCLLTPTDSWHMRANL
jgi:diguanylate cyclase (GGDEF)-like protein/PAS domain S-box-containing protein